MNGIPKIPQERKTNHQWERKEEKERARVAGEGGGLLVGRHEGEMERKMERKERSRKKKRATKQQSISGACRARQVDTETKWPLSVGAGGRLRMKSFTFASSRFIDRAHNPDDGHGRDGSGRGWELTAGRKVTYRGCVRTAGESDSSQILPPI